MYKLAVTLPPFSPDYSGICSALFELGGMLVIHDASGCTGNYTGYDEPRWFYSKSMVYSSALRNMDAVMGNDEKFIEKICKAALELSPEFICIMGSPVPMVIGSDLHGMAVEIEAKTGIPAFGFASTGLKYYDIGVSEALLAVSKRFVTHAYEKIPHSINLLGATPLDFTSNSNVRDYVNEFEKRGIKVNAVFAMNNDLEKLKKSSSASVNVVISASGYMLAQHFLRQFGTPYVIGQPIGERNSDKLCELIHLAENTGDNLFQKMNNEKEAEILIIGEQVTMHSLRCCLQEDFEITGTDIGYPFMNISEITTLSDIALTSENAMMKAVNSGKYSCVIGDPLYSHIIKRPVNFIPLPHVAVSSKLYWNNDKSLAGQKIKNILRGVI
jgi:nitrogenase molybdenum-iron protein alpha/beta subunit